MKIELSKDWSGVKSTVVVSSIFAFITAFGPLLIDTWNILPIEWRSSLPEGLSHWVATIGFLTVIVARYTNIKTAPDTEGDAA